jgi:hypothetical protein
MCRSAPPAAIGNPSHHGKAARYIDLCIHAVDAPPPLLPPTATSTRCFSARVLTADEEKILQVEMEREWCGEERRWEWRERLPTYEQSMNR